MRIVLGLVASEWPSVAKAHNRLDRQPLFLRVT